MLKEKFKSEILKITKTSKVLKGGKFIRFRIFLVTGNNENKIGFGIGKDVSFEKAFKKAIASSYKNLFKILNLKFFKNYKTIPKIIKTRVKKTIIVLKPKYRNTGVHANSLIYTIFNLAGIKHITAKQIGSNNSLNTIYALFKALKILSNVSTFKFKNTPNLYLYSKKNFLNKILNKKIKNKLKILKFYNLKTNNFINKYKNFINYF